MKKILVLSASLYTFPAVKEMVASGFEVLLADRNPSSAGRGIAHKFKAIDIKDRHSILEWSKEEKIDGIMAINDAGTRTASFVAGELGLPGLDLDTVNRVNDKGLMRDCWAKAGLSGPRYRVVSSFSELEDAVRELKFPCVLKPTDCDGASKGVSFIHTDRDLKWAFDFASPLVKNNRYIVEEFISGTEMSVECFSCNGDVHVLAMSDKFNPKSKIPVDASLNYPANFSSETLADVADLVKKATLEIGVHVGISHTEVLVSPEGPKLIEIGGRPGGGYVFHTIIEAVSGINAPVIYADILTGNSVTLPKIQKRGAVYRFFIPPEGILKEVKNIERAKKIKGVVSLEVDRKQGDWVGNVTNARERAGFVVTCGENRQEAVAIADQVESLVEFVVEKVKS